MQELFIIPDELPTHLSFSLIKLKPLVMSMSHEQVLQFAGPLSAQTLVKRRALELMEKASPLSLSLKVDELLTISRTEVEIKEAPIDKARLILWRIMVDYHVLEKEFFDNRHFPLDLDSVGG